MSNDDHGTRPTSDEPEALIDDGGPVPPTIDELIGRWVRAEMDRGCES